MTPDEEIKVWKQLNDANARIGQVYDQIACTYVPLLTALTETGGALAGGVLATGTYTVGYVGSGATYSFNYPVTAQAVSVRLTASWAAPLDASRAYCMSIGGGIPERSPFCVAAIAAISSFGSGIVNLSSGQFNLVVANANTTALFLYILGYYL